MIFPELENAIDRWLMNLFSDNMSERSTLCWNARSGNPSDLDQYSERIGLCTLFGYIFFAMSDSPQVLFEEENFCFGDFCERYFGRTEYSEVDAIPQTDPFLLKVLTGTSLPEQDISKEGREMIAHVEGLAASSQMGSRKDFAELSIIAKVTIAALDQAVRKAPLDSKDFLSFDLTWPTFIGFNGQATPSTLEALKKRGFGSAKIWGKFRPATDYNRVALLANYYINLVQICSIKHPDDALWKRIMSLPRFDKTSRKSWCEVAVALLDEVRAPLKSPAQEVREQFLSTVPDRKKFRHRYSLAFAQLADPVQNVFTTRSMEFARFHRS